ncbi:FeoA family protein [Marivirga lumbricoides]
MSNSRFTADMATPHQKMEIQDIQNSDIAVKLLEMGFMPGKTLTLLYIAPLGDPLAFQLGDSMIALRKKEAQMVGVSHMKLVVQ